MRSTQQTETVQHHRRERERGFQDAVKRRAEALTKQGSTVRTHPPLEPGLPAQTEEEAIARAQQEAETWFADLAQTFYTANPADYDYDGPGWKPLKDRQTATPWEIGGSWSRLIDAQMSGPEVDVIKMVGPNLAVRECRNSDGTLIDEDDSYANAYLNKYLQTRYEEEGETARHTMLIWAGGEETAYEPQLFTAGDDGVHLTLDVSEVPALRQWHIHVNDEEYRQADPTITKTSVGPGLGL